MTKRENPGERLHAGHRGRMRAKLLNYGTRVFETYELMEMLLYTPIRYRDTNPPAKRIFKQYKSLDEVFEAGVGGLSSIEGIGEKTAEFVFNVGRGRSLLEYQFSEVTRPRCDRFDKTGEMLVDYFKEKKTNEVVMLLLDNKLSVIDMSCIFELDYESAGVRPKEFISRAIKTRASVAIIAHNHPFGPACPSRGDIETNRMIASALEGAGVYLVESYVVCGDEYVGLIHNRNHLFSQRPDVLEFLRKRGVLSSYVTLSDEPESADIAYSNLELTQYLSDVLTPSVGDDRARKLALSLLSRYGSIPNVFSVEVQELTELAGLTESDAVLLKIVAALISRSITERTVFGSCMSEADVMSYFKGLFLGKSVECVYALMFDKEGRSIACEFVCDGTVNTASVSARRLIELAAKHQTHTLVLAHNHPSGVAKASDDDMTMTAFLSDALNMAGLRLDEHYVIAGNECEIIRMNTEAPTKGE